MKLISWNVNGIRTADNKGLFDWFKSESRDVLCLQEIKALPDQFPPHLRNRPGYHIYINSAERKGYSGVATFAKKQPIFVKNGFGIEKFDKEGRVLITEYPDFVLRYIENSVHAATRFLLNNDVKHMSHFIDSAFDMIWLGFSFHDNK